MADNTKLGAKDLYLELGVSGLNRFGNLVAEEWLADLKGARGSKVYTEMKDNDPIIGAVLFAIKAFCRSVTWSIDPGGNGTGDLEVADFVESCRGDMSHTWQSLISQILSAMLPYGWSFHELVYKQRLGRDQKDGSKRSKFDDGYIGWRKLPGRAPRSLYGWQWGEDGSLEAMVQQAPPDYAVRTIPLQKGLLFRTDEDKDNPEGRSILRNAYRPWFFKTKIEEFEAIGVERDAVGTPVFWAPSNIVNPPADDPNAMEARTQCLQVVQNLKRHEQEGVLMPLAYDKAGNKKYDLTLLEGGAVRGQSNTPEIIQRYDTKITQTCLAEFMMLGVAKSGGSYALSQDKTDYFSLAVTGFLDEISEVFTVHAIPRLLELNPFQFENYPVLNHGEIKRVDPEKLAAVIKSLADSGMPLFPSTDGSTEKWLLDAIGIPEPVEDDRTGTDDGSE
jgi:hypothetical protein